MRTINTLFAALSCGILLSGNLTAQELGKIDTDSIGLRVEKNEVDIADLEIRVSDLESPKLLTSSPTPKEEIVYPQVVGTTPISTVEVAPPIVMSGGSWGGVASSGGSNGNIRSVASGQSNGTVKMSGYSTSMLSSPRTVVRYVSNPAPAPAPIVRREVVRVPMARVTTSNVRFEPVQQNCPGGLCPTTSSRRPSLGSALRSGSQQSCGFLGWRK